METHQTTDIWGLPQSSQLDFWDDKLQNFWQKKVGHLSGFEPKNEPESAADWQYHPGCRDELTWINSLVELLVQF